MRVLIVEDEPLAARTLESLIFQCDPTIIILDKLNSVEETAAYLSGKPLPDLIFLDIHLSDGTALTLFENGVVNCPIVFTTAFDSYAVKAFDLNSLDYLLKPISVQRLQQALEKYHLQRETINSSVISQLSAALLKLKDHGRDLQNKDRFLVKSGTRLITLATDDIAYFYRDEGLVFAVTSGKKTYHVNYSLDELEDLLAPSQFFRLNRQVIAKHSSLMLIHSTQKGKLIIQLTPEAPFEVIISHEKASTFKKWLEGDS